MCTAEVKQDRHYVILIPAINDRILFISLYVGGIYCNLYQIK